MQWGILKRNWRKIGLYGPRTVFVESDGEKRGNQEFLGPCRRSGDEHKYYLVVGTLAPWQPVLQVKRKHQWMHSFSIEHSQLCFKSVSAKQRRCHLVDHIPYFFLRRIKPNPAQPVDQTLGVAQKNFYYLKTQAQNNLKTSQLRGGGGKSPIFRFWALGHLPRSGLFCCGFHQSGRTLLCKLLRLFSHQWSELDLKCFRPQCPALFCRSLSCWAATLSSQRTR